VHFDQLGELLDRWLAPPAAPGVAPVASPDASPVAGSIAVPAANADLARRCEELDQLLARQMLSARRSANAIANSLPPGPAQEEFAPVSAATERLDYTAAREHLARFCASARLRQAA
jgi:hypothetical protein